MPSPFLYAGARQVRPKQLHLLPVIGQHLLAGLAERGAVLLQAAQDHHVAVVHLGSAMACDVTGTTRILSRLSILGESRRRQQKQGQKQGNDKKPDHGMGAPIAMFRRTYCMNLKSMHGN
jgi:hypothetical protein